MLPKLNRSPAWRGFKLKVAWFIFALINVFMLLWTLPTRKAILAALLARWSVSWVTLLCSHCLHSPISRLCLWRLHLYSSHHRPAGFHFYCSFRFCHKGIKCAKTLRNLTSLRGSHLSPCTVAVLYKLSIPPTPSQHKAWRKKECGTAWDLEGKCIGKMWARRLGEG